MNEEFCDYLKSNSAFFRFMVEWITKYKCLGRLGGSILIKHAREDEKESIGGLLGKDYSRDTDIKISYQELIKALSTTKFAECDFMSVCELYSESKIITNKEKRIAKAKQFDRYVNQLVKDYDDSYGGIFLNFILTQQDNLLILIRKDFFEQKVAYLKIILNSLDQLPIWQKEMKTLATFASQVSSDPHYFDSGKTKRFLLEGINCVLQKSMNLNHLDEVNLLLYSAGLIKDDLSNHCMLFRINALNKQNETHPAWDGFYTNFEMWNVSLYNLQNTSRLYGVKKVYIVENPSVFRTMCLMVKTLQLSTIGLLCIEGQPNLTAQIMLDVLYQENIEMYYSGDFDPEGLLIADKLKRKYPKLILWHYTKKDYDQSISKNELSSRRISVLDNCICDELEEICMLLKKEGKAGYQESLESIYLQELENSFQ